MLLEFFRINLPIVDFYIKFCYNIIEKRNKVVKILMKELQEAIENIGKMAE